MTRPRDVDDSLRRIAAGNPRYNAFVGAVTGDDGLPSGGPLAGMPCGVKDVVDVAGRPTRNGSRHCASAAPADHDAVAVARLRAAGAMIVGKTVTHEFAFGPTGDRSAAGPSRNPRDPRRMTGGSSGGSAAAVAAGMVPFAVGTDTGGSVRIPASLCGVVGYKPPFAAVPLDGVQPLAPSLDHVGVLADSVELAAVAAAVMAGGRDDGPAAPAGRVALLRWDGVPVDTRLSTATDRVVRDAGLPADVVAVAGHHDVEAAVTAVQGHEAAEVHRDRLATAPHLFDPEVLARLRSGERVGADELSRAGRVRRDLVRRIDDLLDRYAVLITPTTPVTAPVLGRRLVPVPGCGDAEVPVPTTLLSLTRPWSLLGLPAISVPALDVAGMPAGVQLVARDPATVLAYARHLETVSNQLSDDRTVERL